MKKMTTALVLLLLINALLLYVHYQEANDSTTNGNGNQFTYDQEIEIINRHDELIIRHHFSNLPQNRLEIVWPVESEYRTCHVEGEDTCFRLDEHVTAFTEGEETRQSISYVMPKNDSTVKGNLFISVFATLHNANPNTTVIHLTDEMNRGGMWVTGLREVGNKRLDLIDYTLFTGEGAVTDIYWQEKRQNIVYSSDRVTMYGSNMLEHPEGIQKNENLMNIIGAPHSTIILNEGHERITSNRFIITENKQMNIALHQYILNQIDKLYITSSEDTFAVEIAASFILNEEMGAESSRNAYKVLQSQLTSAEIEKLTVEIKARRGQVLNAGVLNQVFEQVTGYRTSFFTKNSQLDGQPYPFILESPQDIVVSGTGKLEKHAIVMNSQVYYPISEVMKRLGYTVTVNDHSLYIENASRKYRFPMREHFYVYNQKRYATASMPFERIEDEFYFVETAMIRIFQLEIEKTSKVIEITPIAILK
ncbi:hypothetical protein [Sporosarcina ureilytica]|uniref:Copper amine oxidase-like N-terminal domain-containing protein n=1 Tax=Sporosarcina ureilytica TaxID=298596 RepID=A0A1D8JI24_9BACL|nr:hypothetical protein [Sporosarcina ureilytica]AOV08367.1 hypothetical protein BI350_13030 [Sporosarcina ureilytica]